MDTSFDFPNLRSHQISEIRIILWDIDGTLMTSTRSGAYKEYFAPALKRVYGSAGNLENMQVSGMTDTQIAFEALKNEGFTPEKIFAEKENLLKVFKEEMSRVISRNDNPYQVFKGVREILEKTHEHRKFTNSLLTGNLSCAAEIKLRFVDLWNFFEKAPNAFGEISHNRRDLACEAGKLFNEFLKSEIKPAQFIIIGDTPNDIDCAKHFGAKSVAVATGKNHSPEELKEHKPDVLLENLEKTEEVLEILDSL